MNKMVDFIVIGGGPAGSTIATQLARKGYSVTVFEKEKFPRDHVGESLLPFCYQMMEELKVLEYMKKYTVRKPGVMFISADGSRKKTYCFDKVIHDESALAFHVLRDEFDDFLLKNSVKFGAVVHEETKVTGVELNRPDETVKVEVKYKSGKLKTHFAKQLIDASGQDTFLIRKMNCKKSFDNLDRVAFYTHWMLDSMPKYIDVGIQPIVYLGGEKAGWIFIIPVGVNRISVGVVVNNSFVKSEKAKITSSGIKDWQNQFYQNELNSSPFVANLLRSAKRRENQSLVVIGDYSYYSDIKYGNDFALTGDSSTFLDPIFSSGVYLSMKSSFLLAEAFDKKFRGGDMKDNSALENCYSSINGAYSLMTKFINYFYNSKALDLTELNNSNMDLNDHIKRESSFQLLHYLLAGDFFSEFAKYDEILEMLQNPKHYMRFKNISIDKHERNTPTCNYKTSDSYSKELMEAFLLREK
jgi:flavin-dependent dehydrogenase